MKTTPDGIFHMVTKPRVSLPPILLRDDPEGELEDTAHKAEVRLIRSAREVWSNINKHQTFDNWATIGSALCVGKAHALKVTGANAAWGQNYSRVFCEWIKEHGFERMAKSTRSVAIELAENLEAIEQWRATLTVKERNRLLHPLSNVRRWRRETGQLPTKSRCHGDIAKEARAMLRKLKVLLARLPTKQATTLREEARCL